MRKNIQELEEELRRDNQHLLSEKSNIHNEMTDLKNRFGEENENLRKNAMIC